MIKVKVFLSVLFVGGKGLILEVVKSIQAATVSLWVGGHLYYAQQ